MFSLHPFRVLWSPVVAAGAADDSGAEPEDSRPPAPETIPVFATITDVPNAPNLRGEQVLQYIQPGRVLFGRYEVVRELGRGGMGTVYLVRHLALDVERALKTIVAHLGEQERPQTMFRREARIMARFLHPHSVTVHHAEFAQDVAFIDMEYIQGTLLSEVLRDGEAQPLDWVARVLQQLCDTLQAAHDQGIVHRDIKPGNLMLLDGRARGREFLKVLDFGVSKIVDLKREGAHQATGAAWSPEVREDREMPGDIVGTPGYMSPEQAQGLKGLDHRTDLYSLGVVLYKMLTGRPPFDLRGARELIRAHVEDEPPPFRAVAPAIEVPPEIEHLVMRCLAKDPEKRPQSAREIMEQFIWALPPRFAVAGGTVSGAEATRFRPPPGYVLLERLGKGGFGEVWKAADRVGILVALKFLSVEEESKTKTEWEALQAMKNIRHANLCVPMMVWQTTDALVIGMELADSTLHSVLAKYQGQGLPGVPRDEVFSYLRDAARALDFLNRQWHDLGGGLTGHIYHCDVKPKNILLMGGSVKVADFGLAKLATHSTTAHAGGTYFYMAPERFNDRAARQTDQYSLAITYCELRGGRVPFTGPPARVMNGHLHDVPDLSMLPEIERQVVLRALDKDPRKRWATCVEFIEVLEAVGRSAPETKTTGWRGWFSQAITRVIGGPAAKAAGPIREEVPTTVSHPDRHAESDGPATTEPDPDLPASPGEGEGPPSTEKAGPES